MAELDLFEGTELAKMYAATSQALTAVEEALRLKTEKICHNHSLYKKQAQEHAQNLTISIGQHIQKCEIGISTLQLNKDLTKKLKEAETRRESHLRDLEETQETIKYVKDKLEWNKQEAKERQHLQEQIEMWEKRVQLYRDCLGMEIKKTDNLMGLIFIFKNINSRDSEEQFTFQLNVIDHSYVVVECNPAIEDIKEIVGTLNNTNDLNSFVVEIRKRFCKLARHRQANA